MSEETTPSVGKRVAELRKLHGWTQQQFAAAAHVSVSLVKKVEGGQLPATPAFTAAAARALGLTVPDLYGQPTPRFGTERGNIADLETAIMEGENSVAAVDVRKPLTLDQLAADVAEVQRLQRHSDYQESSARMAETLRQLHFAAAAAPTGEQSERAHHLLATLYECAVICLHRLGSPMCGWAAERATASAGKSGDPLLLAVVGSDRGLPLMHRGSYSIAQSFADEAQRIIADRESTPVVLAVRGSLHLRSAIVAARQGDRSASDGYLAEARDLARFVPAPDFENTDYYDTAFSAINVGIHAVAAAVELADGTTAVTRADGLAFPPGTMPSRMGHHYIDLASAWVLHGDRDRALDALHTARRLSPQQTRYHPSVRETLHAIAASDRRSTESLSGFARWAGVTLSV